MKIVASKNGLRGVGVAAEMLSAGNDTLDAAIAAVRTVEDDPQDLTVGYGGLPNEEGEVELDAAVMHGPTHRSGAVAGLKHVRHAADVARCVMQSTNHVLLVGEGARRFAEAHGFPLEDLLTEKARKLWLYWKQFRSRYDDWVPPDPEQLDPEVAEFFRLRPAPRSEGVSEPGDRWSTFDRPTGTVHCAALNDAGEISCATTTSGLAFKIPGRVGDSPLVGAGLYVDADVGSCGSTGRGESVVECAGSHAAVELMRQGAEPEEAGRAVLQRIVQKTATRLRDEEGRPRFNVKFYLLRPDGAHAAVSLWGPARYAVADEDGARLEDCACLFQRSD